MNRGENIAPIKGRILQYIDFKCITKAKFSRITGISLSNFKGNSLRSEISSGALSRIIASFSDVSAHWLLTGQGEMLKT